MVATVLRLRYRSLGNTLARNPWQLVGFCFGALWGLGALFGLVVLFIAMTVFQSLEVAQTVAVIGGSLLLFGWLVGPILVAGMDTTVSAERLAPFPLRTGEVMRALAAVGLTGIPGILTSLAALASIILWVRWPLAAVVAIPCVVIAVLTCVVATRLMADVTSGLGANRRGREVVGTVVLVLLIMSGPIITGVLTVLDDGTGSGFSFTRIAEVLGWTPLGAAWAVSGDVAAGSWASAGVKFLIAGATLIGLWLVWRRVLDAAMTSPHQQAARTAKVGALGLFGRMPTGGMGATWARALTAWLKDPRYLRQLLVVPLIPVLFAFTGGSDGPLFIASPVIVGLILAAATYADISYDGTAFASVLATGIRGVDDRLGRLLGSATVGIPLMVLVAVATTAISGSWPLLPAILGGALGILLVGYGVCAVSSALIVTPVAAAGDSPFRSVPGQSFVTGLLVFVVWGACAVLAAPALILSMISLFGGSVPIGWISLVVGLIVGVAVIIAGVIIGGRAFDRGGPALLARIKAFPT